ncbi:hypothetical protein ACFV1F_33155 [Streptomyces sp. NPDC059590]|uniref:hypothetical protein n=1 Tax=unclassified Streptomyces TaxID=2593676 RepID=UPI0036895C0D
MHADEVFVELERHLREVDGEPQIGQAAEQRGVGDVQFDVGQRMAGAVVRAQPERDMPEGCLYCRTVVDLGLCDRPCMGMIIDCGSATALLDLLSAPGLSSFAGPVDRREQRRDPRASS